MDYQVVPFVPEHLAQMGYPPAVVGQAERNRSHPGWTGLRDGQPFASAGVLRCGIGVGEAWVVLKPGPSRRDAVFFYREVARRLPSLGAVLGLRRLQASVLPSFAEGVRLVEHLGFQKEATLRKYGPKGESIDLYVLFPEEVS